MKVVSAIERCRTAALGGHVARCEDCAHTVKHQRIAFLLGKLIDGVFIGMLEARNFGEALVRVAQLRS
jgi:hypothetical protein